MEIGEKNKVREEKNRVLRSPAKDYSPPGLRNV
jgi:hypothetical protein